ncbi:DUF4260 domain-containing protein [Salegentibacter flavus]|uniref:DUF4260 domain-containing protein n=1 Tax=Salegentibacter flavus TaxID=287099 RepID=A0A1I4XYC3_9FLAO|nr:DUF4260 domain-containing protein [Salegentibacter flavus]SFN30250.1 protein of unknown function [Salegentibacter flavus]
MKLTLKLEELAMLLLGILAFSLLDFAWWWFLVLFLVPDLGMLGYLFGNKSGALLYNLFHHKGLAILIWLLGFSLENQIFQLIGVILFAHASFDRMLGYGLKYETGFKFTHLGEIGK